MDKWVLPVVGLINLLKLIHYRYRWWWHQQQRSHSNCSAAPRLGLARRLNLLRCALLILPLVVLILSCFDWGMNMFWMMCNMYSFLVRNNWCNVPVLQDLSSLAGGLWNFCESCDSSFLKWVCVLQWTLPLLHQFSNFLKCFPWEWFGQVVSPLVSWFNLE